MKRGAVFRARAGTRGSRRRRCCRFGASSRSCCCCWFFFSSVRRWSIGSGSGVMDVNFGPQERILWPASILAGIVICGAVSFPRLAVGPSLFSPPFTVSLAEFQAIGSYFVPFKPSTHGPFLLICDRVVVPVAICVQTPQIFHHYTSFFFW